MAYDTLSIEELEQVPITEIRRFAKQNSDFVYQVNDTDSGFFETLPGRP